MVLGRGTADAAVLRFVAPTQTDPASMTNSDGGSQARTSIHDDVSLGSTGEAEAGDPTGTSRLWSRTLGGCTKVEFRTTRIAHTMNPCMAEVSNRLKTKDHLRFWNTRARDLGKTLRRGTAAQTSRSSFWIASSLEARHSGTQTPERWTDPMTNAAMLSLRSVVSNHVVLHSTVAMTAV